MKRKIDQNQAFATLRRLPPEVSFTQVEQWVKQHRFAPLKSNHWLASWLARFNW